MKNKHGGAGRNQGRKKGAPTKVHQIALDEKFRARLLEKYSVHQLNKKIKDFLNSLE